MTETTKIFNVFLYNLVTLTKAEEVRNCWVHGSGCVFCNESTEGEHSDEPKNSLFHATPSLFQVDSVQVKSSLFGSCLDVWISLCK